jgi:hypothetical protein
MQNITYSIKSFDWDKLQNTFTGYEDKLYNIDTNHYYQISFPNQRGKFYIKNEITGGFRRFLYHREFKLSDTEMVWVFKSEDNINCEIIKNI